MSQQRRIFGNSVSDLTGPSFEPQTSRSREERFTARPTGRQKEANGIGRKISVCAGPILVPVFGSVLRFFFSLFSCSILHHRKQAGKNQAEKCKCK